MDRHDLRSRDDGMDASLRAQRGNPWPRYFRPTEVASLLGDPAKAKQKLGWVPKITLDELVQEMVATDLADAKKHALLKQHGYNVRM